MTREPDQPQRSRGFAFVHFEQRDSAAKVRAALHCAALRTRARGPASVDRCALVVTPQVLSHLEGEPGSLQLGSNVLVVSFARPLVRPRSGVPAPGMPHAWFVEGVVGVFSWKVQIKVSLLLFVACKLTGSHLTCAEGA
jgi:hypothetical protein